MRKTFKMDDVVIALRSDWETAQQKVPELAREILSYYAHEWNEGETEEKIQHYIDLVWNRRMAFPTYPFGDSNWLREWEKVKVWYIASLLEQYMETIVYSL